MARTAELGRTFVNAVTPSERRGHPVAWMAWGACAAAAALLLRHPVYLALIGLAGAAVLTRGGRARAGWGAARIAAVVILFPAVLNGFLSRSGTTVLVDLHRGWIGGPYTLEALLFGLTAGVQIAALLVVMAALQRTVDPTDVLRRMPASLYPLGVSAAVGLSFTARARRALRAIQEAQLVRGHRPRGWRDFPGWATPLLVLSLENAQDTAEAMVARGWSSGGEPDGTQLLAAAGWLGWAAALLLAVFVPGGAVPALALAAAATTGILVARRGALGGDRYRPEVWLSRDSVMTGLAVGSAAAVSLVALGAPALLTYSPYPTAGWPSIQIAMVAALALFAAPAWWVDRD